MIEQNRAYDGGNIVYKTIYGHAAEMTQEVIKARGEAIGGQKELIEAYLSDEAVTTLYNKISKTLHDQFYYEASETKYYFLHSLNYLQLYGVCRNPFIFKNKVKRIHL